MIASPFITWTFGLFLVPFVQGCFNKPIDLTELASSIESITVYDLEARRGSSYSQADLNAAFQEELDVDLFKELASTAKYDKKFVICKGSRLAIAQLEDGTETRFVPVRRGGIGR